MLAAKSYFEPFIKSVLNKMLPYVVVVRTQIPVVVVHPRQRQPKKQKKTAWLCDQDDDFLTINIFT